MRWSFAPLVAAAAFGCSRGVAPSAEINEPEAQLVPVHTAPRPAPPPADVRTASAPPPFALTELAPTQGDLLPLLADQFARAQKRQLRPVVEFYADWCGPCRAFQASLGEPSMTEALRGTFLIKLNMDDWHDKLGGTGYDLKSIPFFYLLGPDGRPAGKVLDGDKWGKSTVGNMSAAIRAFLAP